MVLSTVVIMVFIYDPMKLQDNKEILEKRKYIVPPTACKIFP